MVSEIFANATNKDESVVYVFNRQLLDRKTVMASLMPVSPDLEPPVPLNVLIDINLSDTTTLLDRCNTYSQAFRSHVTYGQATLATLVYHVSVCERSLNEQKAQVEALNIVLTNLKGHSRSLCEAFDAFYLHAQRELAKHTNRLQSFPTDMQALHRLPIHPSIADGNKYLSDYVPEDKLITWADNCRVAHGQLVRKVTALAEAVKSIKSGTDSETSQPFDVNFRQLEAFLADVKDARQRVESKQQRLERDFSRVEDILSEMQASTSSVVSDKITSLDHLHKIHRTEYLPKITEIDTSVRQMASAFIESKVHLSQQLQTRLQSISHIQSQIASVTPTLTGLTNLLNAHIQAFTQLLHVHRMPAAWGATLVEIVRRREFVRVFLAKAKDMAEILARFRTHEEKRREAFKNEIGRYLPPDLVPGLDDRPPICEVSVSNTKDGLPDISREDIADFEKLVTSIHSSMVETEPIGPSASQTHSNHTISKLIATMVKMASQVDATPADFERILSKTGFSERLLRLEEENMRLRAQLQGAADVQPRMLISRSPSSGPSDMRDASQVSMAQMEVIALRNKMAEYEARCAVLETRSQEYDAIAARLVETEQALETERRNTTELRATVYEIGREREQWLRERQESIAMTTAITEENNSIKAEVEKSRSFYDEVREGLEACGRALHRRNEDESTGQNTDSQPDMSSTSTRANATPDEIRRALRELQDDILCQTAQLASMKASITEGDSTSESVEGEIVALLTQVGNLREDLNAAQLHVIELRDHLTATEAREAIVEADLHSTRALLKRAEEDLAMARQKLKSRETDLEVCQGRLTEKEHQALTVQVEADWLKKRVNELEDVVAGLQEDQKQLNDELASRQAELGATEADIEQTRATLAEARQQVSTLMENLHVAETSLLQRNEEMQTMEKEQQNLAGHVASLTEQLARQGEWLNEKTTEMERLVREVGDKESQLQEAVEKSTSLQNHVQEKISEVETLRTTVSQLERNLANVQLEIAEQTQMADALRKQLIDTEGDLAEQTQMVDALRKSLTAIKEDSAAVQIECTKTQGNVRQESEDKSDPIVADIPKKQDCGPVLANTATYMQAAIGQLIAYHEALYSIVTEICGSETAERVLSHASIREILSADGITADPEIPDVLDRVWLSRLSDSIKEAHEKLIQIGTEVDPANAWTQVLERWKDLMEREVPHLRETCVKAKEAGRNKITFKNFRANDLALFLPTRNPKAWAAFNVNSPHFFLSPEVSHAFAERMRNRDYILAFITDIKEHVVDPGDPTSNPFGLATKTRFRLCMARAWEPSK
ncbi:hypothetical protein, variant 2 [Spizellomyces punctatus DAOM BR117]|nr:hypothetical protein, variant 2 [Spizellomyces punctatus DAOM BR117]KND04131.1 hypothetical protein, variant 2 [Spizellomyces punctatus DAOM BR117]|eukprot:XP_016612170.1 hypothetical protein, variant 2 [Spizellomyces punctatus DAOM BR117]